MELKKTRYTTPTAVQEAINAHLTEEAGALLNESLIWLQASEHLTPAGAESLLEIAGQAADLQRRLR